MAHSGFINNPSRVDFDGTIKKYCNCISMKIVWDRVFRPYCIYKMYCFRNIKIFTNFYKFTFGKKELYQ